MVHTGIVMVDVFVGYSKIRRVFVVGDDDGLREWEGIWRIKRVSNKPRI